MTLEEMRTHILNADIENYMDTNIYKATGDKSKKETSFIKSLAPIVGDLATIPMANYLVTRGGVPTMSAIPAVKNDWKDAKEVFEAVLKHEQHVTDLINKLADVADEEKDRASQNFVAKYIDEQVEEEKNVRDILLLFKQMPLHTLAHIDRKVGERE